MKRPNKTVAKPTGTTFSPLARAPKRATQIEIDNSVFGRILSVQRGRRIAATLTFGSLLALTVLTGVATFSPLLAIQKISIVGTERLSEEELAQALEGEIGTPLPLLNQQRIAASLAGFELIESFSATAVPPNELRVRISERQALCIIDVEGAPWLHDPAGVRIGPAEPTDLLPTMITSENPKESDQFKYAVQVLLALPQELLGQVEFIEARSKDDVQMSLRGNLGQKIIWGDSSEAVLKSKVLQVLLLNNQGASSVVFDVSSPNAPVARFENY
jgi:cell division protein FtsQ